MVTVRWRERDRAEIATTAARGRWRRRRPRLGPERAALVGGSIESGPRDGGGSVTARLPYGGSATTRVLTSTTSRSSGRASGMILESEPEIEVVGEAADGLTGARRARDRADVILMDVRCRTSTASRRRADCSRKEHGPRILILTTFDLDDTLRGAPGGASGFLLKDTPEQLVEAIASSRAATRCSPVVTRRDRGVRPQAAGRDATPGPGLDELTARSFRDPAADRARAVERGDRGRGVRQR